MIDTLNLLQIPTPQNIDLTLGTRVTLSPNDDNFTKIDHVPVKDETVYWLDRTLGGGNIADCGILDLFKGRVLTVFELAFTSSTHQGTGSLAGPGVTTPGSSSALETYLVSVLTTPDGDCQEFPANTLWQHNFQQLPSSSGRPTRQISGRVSSINGDLADLAVNLSDLHLTDEELLALSAAYSDNANSGDFLRAASGKLDAHGGNKEPDKRERYQPADPQWEYKEILLLSELERRQRIFEEANPPEPEPLNIDGLVMVRPGTATAREAAAAALGSGSNIMERQDMKSTEVGTRVRRGFDLVRIGNFHEAELEPHGQLEAKNHIIPDIAFFHHRPTLHTNFTSERQRFVRQCCGVLRDVAAVFRFDAAMVTLFYEGNLFIFVIAIRRYAYGITLPTLVVLCRRSNK
jgi:hypothetical protein